MITKTELIKICSAFTEAQSIVKCERIINGFSNHNFLIRTEQQSYLLKYYKTHWPNIGLEAQRFLSGFSVCPAPIWLDKVNQHAAFNYIEGDVAQSHISSIPRSLINKLVQVHNYDIKTEPMDIAKELFCYQQSLVYKQYQPQIEAALKVISRMSFDEGFCHNDLVKENIIVNATGMYLIDFEYAKTNDVYFDLASLAVSFNLSEHSESILLADYKKCISGEFKFTQSIDKLNNYKLLYLVLCVGWYEQRAISNKSVELRAQLDDLISQNKIKP
ncbi:phosphotransferase [Pseudoalteromonas sp. Z9A5]|uniref:phosphotransferase n=1 Tax=Pseudoalteromonas sp. Z9A5 TaxID=2686355 RepID=UPI00140B94C9|nr:phosphotransferase [Pseudoalteromonas sp. Z9A5]